jgi:uncharacterized damage-inducible protein DinB
MKQKNDKLTELFLAEARATFDRYLRRIGQCLALLPDEEIWWRPNPASNSAGNLVLHLCGNVRQWVISGLGGAPDVRERDKEFSERGVIPRTRLLKQLRATVREANSILARLPAEALTRKHTIQGFHVTGLAAVSHVYEHFAHHTGQIIYITKLKRARDLRFTRLPAIRKRK